MLLDKITSPADVKSLDEGQLGILADEIRQGILNRVSHHGGHVGPDLGFVEATIALHRVFDAPTDKIVFDVSHQIYPHKMLTGRAYGFFDNDRLDEISGYSSPLESPVYDNFEIGHTSTSVALATGLQKARDLLGGTENVVAVIGDGSLSGGEAFEGLDMAAELGTNIIVVVNDNEMSIAENHGGLYENLAELRRSHGSCENNLFRAMGLDYVYVDKGNDLSSLIEAFRKVKDTNHPVVVHINTLKGKGYAPAEEDKETWHWTMPFEISTGALKQKNIGEDYNSLTAAHLLQRMKDDKTVCAITAGTPGIWGWTPARRQEAGKQFVDVGIAEEHAVALASGMAKAGGKPVFGVCSSFLQRAYDQVSQDLCINDNPATLLVLWGSLTSMTDVTHLCHFDIPLLSGIPNLVFLAPTNREEYLAMLDWSLAYDRHPVAIRVPVGEPRSATRPVPTDFSELNKSELVSRGKDVAILGLGNFFALGEQVSRALKDRGIEATLINPRFISGLDESLLDSLVSDHRLVVTLEDGALEGGYGEKVARHFGTTSVKTLCFGARKEFVDRYAPADFFAANHLTVPQIVEDILQSLGGF